MIEPNRIRLRIAITSIFIVNWLAACGGECVKTSEIKELLNKELKTGDTRQKVEQVLKSAGIEYSFDAFQNRYQATARDARCSQREAASIYAAFDASGKMLAVDVFSSYTAP